MATHSSTLAWKIPWKRKWQPTPVLLPGKSHGQRSLVGYSPWGHKELDKTDWLHFKFHFLSAGSNVPACLGTPHQFVLWTNEQTCTKSHFASISSWHGGAETGVEWGLCVWLIAPDWKAELIECEKDFNHWLVLQLRRLNFSVLQFSPL